MTRTIAVDDRNDIYIGADGNLAVVSDIEATMQIAQQAAQTQLGEMQYAIDQGLPNFETVWVGAKNISQFDAYLRRAIQAVEHVTGIRTLTITTVGNALSYSATIDTDFGPGVING
jgi:hypothetical protein